MGGNSIFSRVHSSLTRYATGRAVLLSVVAAQVIYGTMLFLTIPAVTHHSSGMDILDMLPLGYSTEYVETLFAALGNEGRNAYLFRQIPMRCCDDADVCVE